MQLLSTLLSVALLSVGSDALAAPRPTPAAILPRLRGTEWTNYTTISGFFLQDDVATNPSGFDYVCPLSLPPKQNENTKLMAIVDIQLRSDQ